MTEDVHTWAAAALRKTLRRCAEKAAGELERAGRANSAIPMLKVEARQQLEDARAVRERAKRAGLA